MKRVIVLVAIVMLCFVSAPAAAAADVRPNAQCYNVGKIRESALGTVECVLWSAGFARWRLVPSASTRAGAVTVLDAWWDSFTVNNRADACQRFGKYPRKYAWEVAAAFPMFPTSVMVPAASRVFTARCR